MVLPPVPAGTETLGGSTPTHTGMIQAIVDEINALSAALASALPTAMAPLPSGGDDTTTLQNFLNSSTQSSPKWLQFPTATYQTYGTLTIPFAPGTRITGSGRQTTIINQHTTNTPILKFQTDNTHSVNLEHMGIKFNTQQSSSNTLGVGVYYDVPGGSGSGFYHHVYEDFQIDNAFNAFGVAAADGVQPVWNCSWRDVYIHNITGSAFYLRPQTTIGMPNNHWSGIEVHNYGGVKNTGAVFDFSAVEADLRDLDLEELHNVLFSIQGGGRFSAEEVHVEWHNMTDASSKVVWAANGPVKFKNVGMSIWGSATNTSYCDLFQAYDAATHITMDNVTAKMENTTSTAPNRRWFSGAGKGTMTGCADHTEAGAYWTSGPPTDWWGTTRIDNGVTKTGFFGSGPVARPSGTPAAATDAGTTMALVNDLRSKLLALGLIS